MIGEVKKCGNTALSRQQSLTVLSCANHLSLQSTAAAEGGEEAFRGRLGGGTGEYLDL